MAHVAKRSPGSPGPWNATPVKPGIMLIVKDRCPILCIQLWTIAIYHGTA